MTLNPNLYHIYLVFVTKYEKLVIYIYIYILVAVTLGTQPLSGGIIASPPFPIVTEAPVSGGAIEVSPSLPPIGGGTEPPLSGDAIGVAPSPLPIGGGTEPPLSGGIIEFSPPPVPQGGAPFQAPLTGGVIGVVPPPQSRETPATNDIESSIVVSIRTPHVSTEGKIVFTTKNFGNEDGSNGGSGKEP
ncbi:hypothetical protein Bca52824_069353 [Brassica carinata]|uniref:Uncharacterized protein n=1 Tax=Brassica carinata TaxID=52824 RepID=A0A8X7U219_BRACI|nr:hypothetical protein Bca52824_069353 [Brassica carinata]